MLFQVIFPENMHFNILLEMESVEAERSVIDKMFAANHSWPTKPNRELGFDIMPGEALV